LTVDDKGAVECGVKFCCGRWWRTMTATNAEEAQVSLDHFWATTGDARLRPPGRYADPGAAPEREPGARPRWPSVGELAEAEDLMALPAVGYPATIEVERPVDDRATVGFRGNRYSVPPGLSELTMTLRHRLGTSALEVVSPTGAVLVTHRLALRGSGTVVRTPEHQRALEKVVLAQFSSARPCDKKANHPPGERARAERAKLLGAEEAEPAVDLHEMAEVVRLAFSGTTEASRSDVAL